MVFSLSFFVLSGLGLLIVGFATLAAWRARACLGEMGHMMNGMAFGMAPSTFFGALVGAASNDFLLGSVAGTLVGLGFGIPLGRCGGALGRMEAVMAAPMGGVMGGMTGVMMLFYNPAWFAVFLTAALGYTMTESVRVLASSDSCEGHRASRSKAASGGDVMLVAGLSVVAVLASVVFPFQPGDGSLVLGAAALATPVPSVVAGSLQEITITALPTGYDPEEVTVKAGAPVRLTVVGGKGAGCTRAFVLPAFGVDVVVPTGGSQVVDFTPTRPGDFEFRCRMNMARGVLHVV